MKITHTCFIFALSVSQNCFAIDLMDVYHQALDNDTIFKAAYSTYMANREAIPQARAALLPQLTGTAQTSQNSMNVRAGVGNQQNNPNARALLLNAKDHFINQQFLLTASQTIFDYQAWAQLQQAESSVKAARATFNNAAQDLLLRTASAYFDVLLSRDTLEFAEAKLRANKRQLDQAQQRFNVGVDTITSVYEAQAAYDQSIAEVISAKNNQVNQKENLRKLTNHVYENVAPLRNSQVPLIQPEPADVNEWTQVALKQNYNLLSTKWKFQAARDNIKVQTGGNWPTVSLNGSTAQTFNQVANSNFFVPKHQILSSVGVQMNFPVIQGGLVSSQTRQAQYEFQTASEQVEQVYRDVSVNSQIAFNTIMDGISKVKADRQTLISQQNSLQSTSAQFEVGTRTMVDVVNAQRRLFEAQEQLAKDQYGFINAILRLKYLAGSLNVNDLEEINSWLDTTRLNGLPPTQHK